MRSDTYNKNGAVYILLPFLPDHVHTSNTKAVPSSCSPHIFSLGLLINFPLMGTRTIHLTHIQYGCAGADPARCSRKMDDLGVSHTGSVAAIATTMRASWLHPSSAPAKRTLPIQGSTGNPARALPTGSVNLPACMRTIIHTYPGPHNCMMQSSACYTFNNRQYASIC